MENKICHLFKIKYPIICGGMAGISESQLVSAVSNAGGLGVIGAGLMSSSWLNEEIEKTKKLTENPFGVNLFMRDPDLKEKIKVILKNEVKIVFTGGGNPLPIFPYLSAGGILIVPVVPSPRLAKKMEDNGAEAVVVEGLEAGGHIGPHPTLTLVAQTKEILKKIPLIAAGGIYDLKTAKAVVDLGADGIQMGTRFLASKEAKIKKEYKKKIVEATPDDIEIILRFTGHPLRVIKNSWSEKMKKLEEEGAFPEEVKAEMFLSTSGNVENSPLLAGLSAGGIKEIKSVKEIIEEIKKIWKK